MPASLVVAQKPTPNSSSTPSATPAITQDVALDDNGFLQGVVVNDAGLLQAGVDVLVTAASDGTVVGQTSTNAAGHYQVKLTRGGLYQLSVGQQTTLLRCWAGATAPPVATQQLMVSVDPQLRGQISPSACGLGSPWVIAGLVTAAIVIPIALHNNREDRRSASE